MKMSEVGKKWKKASVMSYRIGHSVLPNMQICHLKIQLDFSGGPVVKNLPANAGVQSLVQ